MSTYPTKTWGAAGDGGFVVGDDTDLLARVRRLGNHGATGLHEHAEVSGCVGTNSRLDSIQAAILLGHAPLLAARVSRRREIAAEYDRDLPRAILPLRRSAGSPVQQYVIRFAKREALRAHLANRGIETAIYYPHALGDQPAMHARARAETPVARALCTELLALPVHEGMTPAEVALVLEACSEVC